MADDGRELRARGTHIGRYIDLLIDKARKAGAEVEPELLDRIERALNELDRVHAALIAWRAARYESAAIDSLAAAMDGLATAPEDDHADLR